MKQQKTQPKLSHYEQQLQTIRKTGMFFYGVKKDFKGKVDQATFFSIPGLIINAFGYYQNGDGTWSVFVTDEERGVEIQRKKVPTEESAIEYLIELVESHNGVHFINTVFDSVSGEIKIATDLIVKPGYRVADFKTTKYFKQQDESRIIYLDGTFEICGHRYVVSLFFRNGLIYLTSLICCDNAYSENEEEMRKIEHDRILSELNIGGEYSWGTIESTFDSRSNVSSINICYHNKKEFFND